MTDYTNTFAFDIGITSIGASAIEDKKLNYMGVRMFRQATEAKEARTFRSARRNTARKKWRKQQLRKAFVNFGIISETEFALNGYSCFTASPEGQVKLKDKTVYHLRKRALSEKVSERELYLCLLNMLHARGHFNMEMYDLSKRTVTFGEYREKFYGLMDKYFQILDTEKDNFEKAFLLPLFEGKMDMKTIRKIGKDRFVSEEQSDTFIEILKLISGYKAKTSIIDESIPMPKESMSIQDIKSADEGIDQFYLECVDLCDLAKIAQIMQSYDYLCEKAVDELEEYEKVVSSGDKTSDQYKEYIKNLEGKTKGKHKRAWRNIDNNYPNGLYVKEAEAILRKQKEFNPRITNEFITAVLSIIKARIPFYIGPLSSTGKNAWVVRDDSIRFDYSYDYMQKYSGRKLVDEETSITEWKKRMISRCTYLPEEYALPKGSFLGETFTIVNELNILAATTHTGDDYYLTLDDKVNVFNTLFLKKKTVLYKEIAECLDLESFGPRKTGNKEKAFNNAYTLYHRIAEIIPDLRINDIMDLFDDPEKIQKIEDIILAVNLYDDTSTKIHYFEEKENYDHSTAAKLAQLKSESFFSFSRKFIFEVVVDGDHGTLISKLFEDNQKGQKNEQMTLITNAVGADGKPLDFISNSNSKQFWP